MPKLRNWMWVPIILFIWTGEVPAALSQTPAGTTPLGVLGLEVFPPAGGEVLDLCSINRISPGWRVQYRPLKLLTEPQTKGEIALIVASSSPDQLLLLESHAAWKPAIWTISCRPVIIALVWGTNGLDRGKVQTLLQMRREIIAQLADYATQTAQIGALWEALAAWERTPDPSRDLQAVLKGVSSRHGVPLPKLNLQAPAEQQAATLFAALVPALANYDPRESQHDQLQQSAGLATSVASLFLGNPVGLAAGGIALFQNLRTLLFPHTEFLPAIPQHEENGGLLLFSKAPPHKSRTRTAYLWATRIPDLPPPQMALLHGQHFPLGAKATVHFSSLDPVTHRILHRVRAWKLIPKDTNHVISAKISPKDDSLIVDLCGAEFSPGDYHLAGIWDWELFPISGTIALHAPGNLRLAKIAPNSQDLLFSQSGPVTFTLTGTDFQFVDRVTLVRSAHDQTQMEDLRFRLPLERQAREQGRLEVELDTSSLSPGIFQLALSQTGGSSFSIPIQIHPPKPRISNLPLRANLEDTSTVFTLEGNGLESIEKIDSNEASWDLSPASPTSGEMTRRPVRITLKPGNHTRGIFSAQMHIRNLATSTPIPTALEIANPRPVIQRLERSFPTDPPVALKPGEIPAGVMVNFAITTRHLDTVFSLELACSSGESLRRILPLAGKNNGALIDHPSPELLFLSLDAGEIGQPGCQLTATLQTKAGRSDPVELGTIRRLPRILQFSLSEEKISENLYLGTLTGEELQTIEKTGWDLHTGYPVQSLPIPAAQIQGRQTLRIALSWPAPSPHASLYIWLRGESEGRLTRIKY